MSRAGRSWGGDTGRVHATAMRQSIFSFIVLAGESENILPCWWSDLVLGREFFFFFQIIFQNIQNTYILPYFSEFNVVCVWTLSYCFFAVLEPPHLGLLFLQSEYHISLPRKLCFACWTWNRIIDVCIMSYSRWKDRTAWFHCFFCLLWKTIKEGSLSHRLTQNVKRPYPYTLKWRFALAYPGFNWE